MYFALTSKIYSYDLRVSGSTSRYLRVSAAMALWYLDDVPRMAPYSLRHRNLGGLLYHSHHVVVVDYETRSNPLSWSVRIVCTVHILLRLHAFDGSRHLLVASLPPGRLAETANSHLFVGYRVLPVACCTSRAEHAHTRRTGTRSYCSTSCRTQTYRSKRTARNACKLASKNWP